MRFERKGLGDAAALVGRCVFKGGGLMDGAIDLLVVVVVVCVVCVPGLSECAPFSRGLLHSTRFLSLPLLLPPVSRLSDTPNGYLCYYCH